MNYYQNPASLTTRVTDFVCSKGHAKLSEVAEHFPEYSRKQVHDALSNARCRKLIKVIFRGNFRGRQESVWAADQATPTPARLRSAMERRRPAASVWELGTPVIEVWPPKFEGGREYIHLTDDEEESVGT